MFSLNIPMVCFCCGFDFGLFGFVCFLFLLVSGKGCGLSVIVIVALPGFSLTLFFFFFFYYFCHCMSLHVCPGEMFILDSRLVSIWETNCPFGFLLVVF